MSVERTLFAGTQVELYTLTNINGIEINITNYGGTVISLKTPDHRGNFEDIVLGLKTIDEYQTEDYFQKGFYLGALIGRFGNRIANGKFNINNTTYQLATNNDPNHLHGGEKGFDKVLWKAEKLKDETGIKLSYESPHMEEGYPGNLFVEVSYILTDKNELRIKYSATADKATIINLTHHSYFNLCGNARRNILDHEMQLNADRFLPMNENQIPTGEKKEVKNSPFDFTQPKPIGKDINKIDEQLKRGNGYDHCWVLNGMESELKKAATVFEPKSQRLMEVFTTEPGIQLYTGNFLDGSINNKNGAPIDRHHGFCLETQHFPDSPNQKGFPSVTLRPGEQYQSETVYKFSII